MVKVSVFVKFFGRVQGVGFRMHVLSKANDAGINGWVKNMPDHDEVNAVFCGESEKINSLIESLKKSVGMIRVDRVIIEPQSTNEVFESFEIKY